MCILKVKHPSGGTPWGKKNHLIALLLFGPGHQKCSYGNHDNEVVEYEILDDMYFETRRAMMCLNDTSSHIRAGFKVGHLSLEGQLCRQEMSLGVKWPILDNAILQKFEHELLITFRKHQDIMIK